MPHEIRHHGAHLLGQLRPANTNPASIYSPAANITPEITKIIVCNTSGAASSFRIFLDVDGTTYDETTALFWDAPLGADLTWEIEAGWGMTAAAGNLAVRSANPNALTFTVFGRE